MKRMATFFSLLLMVFLSTSLGAVWEAPPAPVYVTVVESRVVPVYYHTVGTLEPAQSVQVRAQAEGYLLSTEISSGQEVQEGQLLFTLDSQRYEAQLEEARAALEREQQALDYAKAQFDRSRQLHASQAISESELKVSEEKIDMVRGQVRVAEARVKAAELPLSYCKIFAPFRGRLSSIELEVGSYVNLRDLLVTIDTLHALSVKFSIPEQRFLEFRPRLQAGELSCELWSPQEPGTVLKGAVGFFANRINKDTGAIALRADVANEEYLLWPGQFVKVRLLVDLLNDAIVLPRNSVRRNEDGPYVFVVGEDDTAELRAVTLGPELDEEVVIQSGVDPRERVITEGQLNVWPGSKVEVKENESGRS